MLNFVSYTPTKVVFGKDTQKEAGTLIKEYGGSKVLLHFGGKSAEKSGLLGQIRESLDASGLSYVELGGVVPNPRLSLVYEGIELCKKENVDFILAVGGGSVIDSAKAIGYGINYDGDVWDIYDEKATPTACTAIGTVLTIAAAGSEMSNSSVITKDEGMIKRGAGSNFSRPKFSILNPELTYTLPAYQTSCGVVDILMHTMERYFTPDSPMMMTDEIALSVLKVAMANGKILVDEPTNYQARAEIMWAGSLSHNDLTGLGVTGDWSTHQLEHELSGLFDVAHGAGLAAVWGSWARYVYATNPARFETFAKVLFDITGDNAVTEGIKAMEAYFSSINMPISIKELLGFDVSDAQIDEMSEKCAFHGRTIGAFKVLDKCDMNKVYHMAKGE